MKKGFLYTSILTVSFCIYGVNYIYASTPPNTVTQEVKKEPILKNYLFLSPEEAVLYHVANARVYLTNGNNKMAKKEVDMAIDSFVDVKQEPNTIQVISFDYGKGAEVKEFSIPIIGSQATNITLNGNIESFIRKGTSIDNARIEYLTFSVWDKNTNLIEARDSILSNNIKEAELNLKMWEEKSFSKKKGDIPNLENARANIALARVMIQRDNYSAAKTAVAEASNALRTYMNTTTDKDTIREYDLMASELEDIIKDIDENIPTRLKQIDNKLEEWWEKMSK
jgi:hypothetical protein